MITGLDYWIESDSLTVCRVYGTGSLAQLPAGVGEMKITALADHTFAQYPSDEIAHHEIFRAVRSIRESAGDGSFLWHTGPVSDVGTPDEPLCGPKVEEIVLPPYLTRVGNYAFYGCRSLSRFTFPEQRMQMGSGAFVDCGRIKQLIFPVSEGTFDHPQMREVLGDMNLETEVIAKDRGREVMALYFPGYYEDSVENTPARIFIMHYEGTGFKYRQCFRNGKIDFDQYDSLFYEASVQETPETAIRLAMDRLTFPVCLGTAAREKYLAFVLREYRTLAPIILSEERMSMLEIICGAEDLTSNILDYFLETARRMRDAKSVGFLQETRRKRFPPKKKEYTF